MSDGVGTTRAKKTGATNKRAPVPHHVRRRQSEDAVLQSAESLFVKNGFHRTTVDDIARMAGLTKGAVYFHFKDKSDVLMALLRRAEDRVLYPILNRLTNMDTTTSAKLVDFLHNWARIAVEQRNTMFLPILMSFEFLGTNDPIEKEINGMYERIYEALSAMITAGRQAGELSSVGTVESQAAVLVAITDGMLLEWLRRSDKLSGPDVTRAVRTLILHGLLPSEVGDRTG